MAETTSEPRAAQQEAEIPDNSGDSAADAGERPAGPAPEASPSADTSGERPETPAESNQPSPAEAPPDGPEIDVAAPDRAASPSKDAAKRPENGDATRGLLETGSGIDFAINAEKAAPLFVDKVVLDGHFDIDPGSPIPELSKPSANAFHAEDRRDPGRPLFALICVPGLPIRLDDIRTLAGTQVRGVLPLVDYGVVEWPHFSRKCFAVIYQRPLGGSIADELLKPGLKEFKKNELVRRTLATALDALSSLATMDITHRAIRPSNLFFLDREQEHIVLGDAFTAPPGFDQPVVFETVERAMAAPGARGRGTLTHDIYALGVTIAFMLLARNPVFETPPREIILAKLQKGSYTSLVGRLQVSVSMLEPLRGMLHDDPDQRWSLEDLSAWMAGQRVQPLQTKSTVRAERGFEIDGAEYFDLRSLAFVMSKHPDLAASAIRDDELVKWISRGLEDKELADAVDTAVAVANAHKGDPRGSNDVLVSRVLMILDPLAPLHYKGCSFMPEGFGTGLAVELLTTGSAAIFAECVVRDLPAAWFEMQTHSSHPLEVRNFAQIRGFLQIPDPGYGIERCLYELNPSLPCLSPIVEAEHVVEIDRLLPALDAMSANVEPTTPPVDRHVAAFIAARFRGDLERELPQTGKQDDAEAALGTLTVLAKLQEELGPELLHGLASWVGGQVTPAIKIYHSRSRRGDIEAEVPRLVRRGALPPILKLLDNPETRRADKLEYDAARASFVEADAEIKRIEKSLLPGSTESLRTRQRGAAITSTLIAMTVVVVYLIL
jgi:hypothetical protein